MRSKVTLFLLVALGILGVLNVVQSATGWFGADDEASEAVIVNEQIISQKRSVAPLNLQGDTMIEETFSVSSNHELMVDVQHTDVILRNGARGEAHVVVQLDGRDMERAREYFEEMNFRVEQSGNRVVVRSERPRYRNWNWDRNGRAQITVIATLPQAFNFEIETSHGDVDMAEFEGRVHIQTSHGDVDTEKLAGPMVRIRTSHGDVDIAGLAGESVEIKTSHGDIELGDVSAEEFTASTSHADIEVRSISGRTDITNSHGDIEVRFTEAADTYLRTSHGDIVITTPDRFPATLDLKGGKVRIASGLDFDGTIERDRANGRIGGGGARIEARTSHGSVTLRQN